MKYSKYLIITITLLLCVTGCKDKENKELTSITNNTSISSKVKSYRANISIRGNDIDENYIVTNKKNKEYEISFIDPENEKSAKVEKGKTTVFDKEGNVIDEQLKYDYTNTDIFLLGFENAKDIKSKIDLVGGKSYTIYNFKVDANTANKMLDNFNVGTDNELKGKAYVNSDNRVYLVIYNNQDISISASYTDFNEID